MHDTALTVGELRQRALKPKTQFGHDPNKLETALLRDRFDRHEISASLAVELEEVTKVLSDTALAVGRSSSRWRSRDTIAKPMSKRNDATRGKIAKALDFYGGRSLAPEALELGRSLCAATESNSRIVGVGLLSELRRNLG